MNIYLDVNNKNATTYFVKPKEFIETHKNIFNGELNDNKGKSYRKKLSYLSKCYDNLKNSFSLSFALDTLSKDKYNRAKNK
ncbi:Plasmodium variant antigen protein Cir/Yir/Bir, putative [Plasmodium chabaudi chabaudi]|uniref:Plasmodium variant antigen protein Cir/Yir/Bir, putative n=1 Tax=Plasmodium chabaudi chabaudi TaxID=31271 RepID=A0A1C6X0T8_PLACU|nr:Plasmodium variant antigen protein Cir/Yir/Bir, putative [Plasmodium chabaudi chabaudi]